MNDDSRLDCSDMDQATDSCLRAELKKATTLVRSYLQCPDPTLYDLCDGIRQLAQVNMGSAATIKELERLLSHYESIMSNPVANTPEMVAQFFMDREQSYYSWRLDPGTCVRLSQVIQRARLDGAAQIRLLEEGRDAARV